MISPELTDRQIERYQRQIILPEIGPTGQKKLLESRVCIIGVGGLGSPAAAYLAGAGVGQLVLVDADAVALDNLHRQILYTADDVDHPKTDRAGMALAARNPEVRAHAFREKLTSENAIKIVSGADFLIDGTDNFDARFVIADTCHKLGVPYAHAGVQRFHGQAITVIPGKTTCYRCIFPQPPPPDAVASCAQTGILGPVAGFFATLQACEAIKCITGGGELLTNRLLTADLLNCKIRITAMQRQAGCPLCGEG